MSTGAVASATSIPFNGCTGAAESVFSTLLAGVQQSLPVQFEPRYHVCTVEEVSDEEEELLSRLSEVHDVDNNQNDRGIELVHKVVVIRLSKSKQLSPRKL